MNDDDASRNSLEANSSKYSLRAPRNVSTDVTHSRIYAVQLYYQSPSFVSIRTHNIRHHKNKPINLAGCCWLGETRARADPQRIQCLVAIKSLWFLRAR